MSSLEVTTRERNAADVRFFCGVGETAWNGYPTAPGPLACVSPVYGKTTVSHRVNTVALPAFTQVIQDSGAFSDNTGHRLSFADALRRQETHAERYGYADQICARASYDLLIDEMWSEDEANSLVLTRNIRRWTEAAAEEAVGETVQAARYLAAHRNGLPCILSAQGTTPRQYLRCVEQIVPFMQDGDIVGLGGFCIVGKFPAQMLPAFRETLRLVVPFLGREGMARVHLCFRCCQMIGYEGSSERVSIYSKLCHRRFPPHHT